MNAPNPLREQATRHLSALVITIEFTLISVMIGVILFPLMDHAKDLVATLQFEYWLYILSGILFILYIWTEVISHSLSFIGWPIEFGHNLIYIVFAMLLAVQMNFLADPRAWFALSLLNALVGAVLVLYDRRVIQRKIVGARPMAAAQYQLALERQNGLVRVLPLTMLNGIIPLALIMWYPNIFLDQRGHLVLVAIQIFFLLVLVMRTIRAFGAWTEPILQKTIEELRGESK